MELTQTLRHDLTLQGDLMVSAAVSSIPFLNATQGESDMVSMTSMAINFLRSGRHPSVQILVNASNVDRDNKILSNLLGLAETASTDVDEEDIEFSYQPVRKVGEFALFTVTLEVKTPNFASPTPPEREPRLLGLDEN